jgi:hypothetical protein
LSARPEAVVLELAAPVAISNANPLQPSPSGLEVVPPLSPLDHRSNSQQQQQTSTPQQQPAVTAAAVPATAPAASAAGAAPMMVSWPSAAKPPVGMQRRQQTIMVEKSKTGFGFKLVATAEALLVTEVVAGGAAQNAGLCVGDILLRINNKSTKGITLQNAVALLSERDKAELAIERSDMGLSQAKPWTSCCCRWRTCGWRRLLRRGESGLGMNVLSPEGGEYSMIGDFVPGGVAQNCGSWRPGDAIFAVNDPERPNHHCVLHARLWFDVPHR